MLQSEHFIFCPLVSGSSGNSTYVACGNTRILIDCGRSGLHIEKCLREIDVDIRTINHILITHAHTDHVQSAGTLSRRYDIPVHASIGTWEEMTHRHKIGNIPARNIKVFKTSDSGIPLEFDRLCCFFFPIPHDARDPVGYRITDGTHTAAVATDLGHITDTLVENLCGTSVVLLESNHDVCMLKNGPYTEILKRRILGDFGHLSNDNAGLFAEQLIRSGTRRIMLGHLSIENNRPDIAWQTIVRVLREKGIDARKDAEIFMTHRDSPSRITTL